MENSFDLLEEKVRKAADLVRRLRKENKALDEDLTKVRGRLEAAEKSLQALERQKGAAEDHGKELEVKDQELKALRRERDEVKSRIARIVEVLEGLD
jgi:chromosome segregation ATPase